MQQQTRLSVLRAVAWLTALQLAVGGPPTQAATIDWAARSTVEEMARLQLKKEEYAKYKHLGNANVWMTLDGRRSRIDRLTAVPQDQWTAPMATPDDDLRYAAAHQSEPRGLAFMCAGTLGDWCQRWFASPPVPSKPAPRGNKPCPNGCNGVGNCNYDLGICQCPAGWTGDDCKTPFKRPCTRTRRQKWNDTATTHINERGEDLDIYAPGHTMSRCAGWCDDTVGACFCGYNSTYGHVPVPQGSPVGTEPIQYGRPMTEHHQPATDMHGKKLEWWHLAVHPWENLYGPKGWCEAAPENITTWFFCHSDFSGHGCAKKLESFCLNQCTGNGICKRNVCHCNDGWYGTACDKLMEGAPLPTNKTLPHHLKPVVREPFQRPDGAAKPQRKRPLIYVYDMPPDYNTRVLQYIRAILNKYCIWRVFDENGNTHLEQQHYLLETYIHEQLLISPHRTMDPEEADFFYVPTYGACLVWPTLDWADGPWFYEPDATPRPMHAMNMMLEAKHWVQQHFPYWDRHQGKDHIFLMVHDEGACYAPNEIYKNAIMLVHWGRTDLNHTSASAYWPDDYSNRRTVKVFGHDQPMDWVTQHEGHPCYTPGKDLVIPAMQTFSSFSESPLLGHAPYKRDILFFFRGDVGLHREWWYSRGIRQSLYRWAMEDQWREKYNIVIGTPSQYLGSYTTMAARSKFCLVAMGDGWSARSEVAVLHGCIPVLINDNVEPVLHGVVDWDKFSIRVPQARLHELPQILLAVNDTQLEHMQRALAQVWTRFTYTTGPVLRSALRKHYSSARSSGSGSDDLHTDLDDAVHGGKAEYAYHPYRPLQRFPSHRDAFSTIIQWLHSRIPDVRGEQGGVSAKH